MGEKSFDFGPNMAPKVNLKLESMIFNLSSQTYSHSSINRAHAKQNNSVTISSVTELISFGRKWRITAATGQPGPKNKSSTKNVMQTLIKINLPKFILRSSGLTKTQDLDHIVRTNVWTL